MRKQSILLRCERSMQQASPAEKSKDFYLTEKEGQLLVSFLVIRDL